MSILKELNNNYLCADDKGIRALDIMIFFDPNDDLVLVYAGNVRSVDNARIAYSTDYRK